MAYKTYREEPSELELKGLDIVLKTISKKYPFIIGYEFTENNPLLYATILSLNLIVDVNKLSEFYNIPTYTNFSDYSFMKRGYSLCAPLDYPGKLDDNPCHEDYFTIKSLFKKYSKYLPEKYKFKTHMKDEETGEDIEIPRGFDKVDIDINQINFIDPTI